MGWEEDVDEAVEENTKYTTVLCKTKEPRYYVKSENQLLLCENLGLKKGLYLI